MGDRPSPVARFHAHRSPHRSHEEHQLLDILTIALCAIISGAANGWRWKNVVLRHIALNLLKQERSAKVGIRNKRLEAAWDERYLLRVIAGYDAIALVLFEFTVFPSMGCTCWWRQTHCK